ncbi:hydrolase [Planctomycetes bacterium K23_9]|uniref:Carboxypeptidase G2 n=1 Tax=Stieleria marina TaxID=1930275 RepID=A0A517P3B8_9BACT|nr:Carboxypeptidase G2 precursor [Planctomycetes bacterium K23_9]
MPDPLQTASDWMHDQSANAAQRLEHWCNQNSWSEDASALRKMADVLCDDFATFGVSFHRINLPPLRLLGDTEDWLEQETGPALIWHHNPSAKHRVLLMIHYDTVYPRGSMPDKCKANGNLLVGPGTVDAKGGIAVIAMAVEAMLKFDLATDAGVSILLNPDEEVGSTASRELMSRIAPKFNAALLFEPSLPNGSLVAARKGSGNFSFVARGKSAHAGRNPGDGRNAIVHLCKIIPALTVLHEPDRGVLLNVGRIAGGGPLNQVPDHAVLQLNTRVVDAQAMERIETSLQRIANEFTVGDYRVSLTGTFSSPPKPVTPAMQQVQRRVEAAGELAGRNITWRDTGGACDGCKLAAFGLPNVDTMGVAGGNLHSPDEFCDLDSIVPSALTVAAFIQNSCSEKS